MCTQPMNIQMSDLNIMRAIDFAYSFLLMLVFVPAFSLRPGSVTNTNSCDRVTSVPADVRNSLGLSHFYQKYTEAYSIPVLGSKSVSDVALMRACYIVRFMLADNVQIRQAYYDRYGRVAIMASTEVTTDIPEHAWLGSPWNTRARGLGATEYAPVTSGAEENVLCYGSRNDRYNPEDILVHELTHGMHLLGAKHVLGDWDARLQSQYSKAKARGLWTNTYAMSTYEEYMAEGVQSFFNVNTHRDSTDGIHGPINTRERLWNYDPALYQLILEMFPCQNQIIKRCEKNREKEKAQMLSMNCGGTSTESGTTMKSTVVTGYTPTKTTTDRAVHPTDKTTTYRTVHPTVSTTTDRTVHPTAKTTPETGTVHVFPNSTSTAPSPSVILPIMCCLFMVKC